MALQRRNARRVAIAIAIALALTFAALRIAGRLPPLQNRTRSAALFDTASTRLGKAITPLVDAHPGLSGIYPLRDARDAFAARYLLARAAQRTLDVQYYIWRKDLSGTLMLQALRQAADRGVRVRLLLDDNNTAGLDRTLAALDAHPNVEIRLFNPFVIRRPRAINYAVDFSRLNRRMHNKSFTADSQAAVIGGRNVGDEYFGATGGVLFADLDAIAVGPVVHEVSNDFDRYWASDSAYPVDRLLPRPAPGDMAGLTSEAAFVAGRPEAAAYLHAVRTSPFVDQLVHEKLPLIWAAAHMMSDDPAKGLGRAAGGDLLVPKLKMAFGEPKVSVDLVSPYFVPGDTGTASFRRWAGQKVRIRILTNALEATDVTLVHAGYAKRRAALLAAGVTLYELRKAAGITDSSGAVGTFGSSGASLHAKTFAVDGARLFIGSFNFDPRSAELNTEMGFVIDSPEMARQLGNVFDTSIPANAYEVRMSDQGKLTWIEHREMKVLLHQTEPGTSVWRRGAVRLFSRLPIEWLL